MRPDSNSYANSNSNSMPNSNWNSNANPNSSSNLKPNLNFALGVQAWLSFRCTSSQVSHFRRGANLPFLVPICGCQAGKRAVHKLAFPKADFVLRRIGSLGVLKLRVVEILKQKISRKKFFPKNRTAIASVATTFFKLKQALPNRDLCTATRRALARERIIQH